MKRILFFVHYNQQNLLSDYIIYWLKALRPLFARVVFISNSPIPKERIGEIKKYAHSIIERPNVGFDFGAWRDGLQAEGWDALEQYDSVTLMNDTCFGPIFPMEEVYTKMENTGADFWGITNHRATKNGMPGTNDPIPEHIQSYFMCFKKKVIKSEIFQDFWNNIIDYKEVNDVIQNYETKLTGKLIDNGFFFDVLFDTKPYQLSNFNMAHLHPDILFFSRVPLIKIKSFLLFNNKKYLRTIISKYSKYPIKLIDNYFFEVYNPNISAVISNKTLSVDGNDYVYKKTVKVKVAIHLHIHSVNTLQKILDKINNFRLTCDLFITTDSEERKEKIILIIQHYKLKHKNIKVYLSSKYNIFPWIDISKELIRYEIIFHYHDNKIFFDRKLEEGQLIEEISESMISGFNNIIEIFLKEKNVGIIIPNIPSIKINENCNFFKNQKEYKNISLLLNNLWKKMQCKKYIDFCTIKTPIMPYGTMFWYRPQALKPLFDLNLTEKDFSEEPLPVDGTIAHAIERLPVYIAWSQGYDFRIAINKNSVMSGFEYLEIRPEIRPEIQFLQNALVRTKTIIFVKVAFKIWSSMKTLWKKIKNK